LAATVVGGIYGFGTTYVSDVMQGKRSSWQEYVANIAGGAASGAVAATTVNVWAASAANSAVSMLTKKALCGEGFDWSDLGQFAGETAIGGVAGNLAGKQVPRVPGREPTKFWSSLTGTVGANTLWRQGGLQAVHEATGKSGWESFKNYFGW